MSRPVVGAFGAVVPVRDVFGPPPPPDPVVFDLFAVPPLAAATIVDPSSLGTWSEPTPGVLRFVPSGFASATTQSDPAAGSTLLWPVTLPDDGAVAAIDDLLAGGESRIVQVAGQPSVATNYAVVAGICNAAQTEYMFAGVDHQAGIRRGCYRLVTQTYTVGAAQRNGNLGICVFSKSGAANTIAGLGITGQGLATLTAHESATSAGTMLAAVRGGFSSIADLRYFVSFVPRGTLASQPATIDLHYAFRVTRGALSVSKAVP